MDRTAGEAVSGIVLQGFGSHVMVTLRGESFVH
jgi:hypothetical protein